MTKKYRDLFAKYPEKILKNHKTFRGLLGSFWIFSYVRPGGRVRAGWARAPPLIGGNRVKQPHQFFLEDKVWAPHYQNRSAGPVWT